MEDSASSLPSIWASMNSWFTPTVLFLFLNLMIGTILFTSNLPNHNHHNNNNNKQEDHNDKTHNQNESKPTRSPSILYRLKSFNFYPHRSQPETSPATHQHHHHHHQQQEEALEIAATQYVFNHPFSHEHDAQQVSSNPNNQDLNPTRFHESESDQYEVLLANAQTHFVFEQNHTVEKVTAHFDVGSEIPDPEDPAHEEENDQFQSLDEVYSIITGGHVNRTKSDTLPASGEVPVKLPAKMKKSASLKSAFNHFEKEKVVEARRPATVRERRSASRATEEDDVEVDAKADDFINKFKNQLKMQRLDSIIRYKDMVNRGTGK